MKSPQRKNLIDSEKFHRINKYLWNTNKYSKADVYLFTRINALSAKYGYCYSSNKWLAKDTSLSEKTIRRSIATLEKDGFIKREMSSNGTVRRIYLSEEVLKNIPSDFKTNPCEVEEELTNDNDYFLEDVIEEEFGPTDIKEESIPEINEKSLNEFLNELE